MGPPPFAAWPMAPASAWGAPHGYGLLGYWPLGACGPPAMPPAMAPAMPSSVTSGKRIRPTQAPGFEVGGEQNTVFEDEGQSDDDNQEDLQEDDGRPARAEEDDGRPAKKNRRVRRGRRGEGERGGKQHLPPQGAPPWK